MNFSGPTLGLLLVVTAGVWNGCFALPSKRVRVWKWEHIWIVYSAVAMCILPVGLSLVLAPQLLPRIAASPLSIVATVSLFGLLWGLGSVLFGLTLARLGLAIGNALISGIIVLVGSLGPLLIGAARVQPSEFPRLLLGLIILVAAIMLCSFASFARDRKQQQSQTVSAAPRSSLPGIGMAVLAGVLSSALNVGFAYGGRLIESARSDGYHPFAATLMVWIPALVSGLLVNAGYTALLITRGRSWNLFAGAGPSPWVRAVVMGLLWFGAIFLYGYGALILGPAGTVYGWALIVGTSILASTASGAIAGEWRGAGAKPKAMMAASILLFLAAFVILTVNRAGLN